MSSPYPATLGNRVQRRAAVKRERSKRVRAQRRASKDALLGSPVTRAALRQRVEGDLMRLRTRAGLHAYTGDDAVAVADAMGRLIFTVAHAAGLDDLRETPECNVLRGCAGALADVAATPASLEQQRAAIVSGLAAAERLLPLLDTWSLAAAALELDALLAEHGLTTGDVERALRQPAASPNPSPLHQP